MATRPACRRCAPPASCGAASSAARSCRTSSRSSTCESGRALGYEVLARWLHPDRGLLPPSEFLPLAEETGLLIDLGARILRDSLAQLAQWRVGRACRSPTASLSVNVGTRQLVDPGFFDTVTEALAETGIDADSLWLEITETALLADVKAATVALRELRSLGLHLSVDDFGTGYSSLTYLKRFPVEAIKIDRSFVAGLGIEQRGLDDRRGRRPARPVARPDRRRGRHRVAAAARPPARAGLRPRPGLPLRSAPPRRPGRIRTRRRLTARRAARGLGGRRRTFIWRKHRTHHISVC